MVMNGEGEINPLQSDIWLHWLHFNATSFCTKIEFLQNGNQSSNKMTAILNKDCMIMKI